MKRSGAALLATFALATIAPREARAQSDSGSVTTLTLHEAVARALAQNPTMAIARDEIRRAHALTEQVRAASLPSVTANATGTRLDSDRIVNGMVFQPATQLAFAATVTLPIVVPQRWVQWSQSVEGEAVARSNEATVRQQLAAAVASAYLDVIAQHRVIEVLERAAENARAHEQYAQTRFLGAVGSRLDEVRASQQLATDLSQLESARTALARLCEALGVLVAANGPIDAIDAPPLTDPPTLSQALHDSSRDRADIRQIEAQRRLSLRVARESWIDYLPVLAAQFSPFNQNPPTINYPRFGWEAQIVLAIPVFDGGQRLGAQHERSALAAEAGSRLEGALRQARAEVRASFAAVIHADRALVQAGEAARLANDALTLAEQAFRVGTATGLDVIDAQRTARDTGTAVAIAENDARRARLGLLVASGRFP